MAPADEPELRSGAARPLSLVITVPVLLVLFTVGYGLVSTFAFSSHWTALVERGAGEIAGQLLRIHLATMLILAVAAGVMGILLARAILRPVQAMVESARQVAAGRLDCAPARVPAAAELEKLTRSFDVMLQGLKGSIEARDQRLMQAMPIGILATDRSGRVSAVSPRAAELLGLPAAAILGRPMESIRDGLEGAATSAVLEGLARLAGAGALPERELRIAGRENEKDGCIINVAELSETGSVSGRIYTLRAEGASRELSEHLGRTDQLAALGTFTLGLAHELRNPLGAVKGLCQLLQLEGPEGRMHPEYLGRMVREVDRVDRFVTRLLELGQEPGPAVGRVTIEEIVRLALEEAAREIEEARAAGIRVACSLPGQVPPLRVEPDRMAQALARLLQNACEAAAPGTTIELAGELAGDAADGVLELRVRNVGERIAPELRDRIFEPFFTTRERQHGLGLTIARQIVVQNGGTLELERTEGEASFLARIPLRRAAPEAEATV